MWYFYWNWNCNIVGGDNESICVYIVCNFGFLLYVKCFFFGIDKFSWLIIYYNFY